MALLGRRSLLVRILQQSRPCWLHLAGIVGLGLFSIPLALLFPLPLKIAVDSFLGHHPLPAFMPAAWLPPSSSAALLMAVGLLLALGVASSVQNLASWWLQTYTGEKLVWDFRAQLLEHTQRLAHSFHDERGATDPAYRIQHDAPSIQYIVIQGILPALISFCTLLGMLAVCVTIDMRLALIALAITPILFVLTRGCSRLVRERSIKIKEIDSSAMSIIQEVLGSIRVIKAFGQERREYERFVRRSNQRVDGQVRLARMQAVFNVLIALTISGGTATTLYLGVRHVRAGVISVGELLVVMAYVAQMYEPLRLISSKSTELETWFTSIERAFALLDERVELHERPDALELGRARGEVEFRNVSFYYGPKCGLRNVSFRLSPGARVGIVGASGAGKSTLLNLLMRFYDPRSGAVLLDGRDIRDYRIADLRRQFSVVLQEPLLFAASIAENIAYGEPNASDEQIIAAARAAHSHEFISRLPEGYESKVGERGAQLSGGERQRISLARAFLRDSPILILDEPTSSVDIKTEAAIMEATEELMRGRLTIMVAHRLSTLKDCDVILALDQGELVEQRTSAVPAVDWSNGSAFAGSSNQDSSTSTEVMR
jgi:ATP-binding cassette subfamily B protein